MSVLIKGMEMPKSCWDCACYHHKVDDGYYDYEICRASGTVFNDGYSSVTGHKDHIDPFKARLDNCPLVPVPPHGRLIDKDALEADISASVVFSGRDENAEIVGAKKIINRLHVAPTIIPAESEGE